MRLEEVNEREHSMKASLQTVDLRLMQLEEFSGRMMNALEKLAGVDQTDLCRTRSGASSCDNTLQRHGSVNSADGYSLYRYHLDMDDRTTEEDDRKSLLTSERTSSVRKSSFRRAPSEYGQTLDVVGPGERRAPPSSCVDILISPCDQDTTKDEDEPKSQTQESKPEEAPAPNSQDTLDTVLTVRGGALEKAKLEATISFPLEKSKALRYYPSEAAGIDLASEIAAKSTIVFTPTEGMDEGCWAKDYSALMEHAAKSPAVGQWTCLEYKVHPALFGHPPKVSVVRPPEELPTATEAKEPAGPNTEGQGNSVEEGQEGKDQAKDKKSLLVPERQRSLYQARTDREDNANVKAESRGRTMSEDKGKVIWRIDTDHLFVADDRIFPSVRSKSLNANPRKTKAQGDKVERPRTRRSFGDIMAACETSTNQLEVRRNASPNTRTTDETDC